MLSYYTFFGDIITASNKENLDLEVKPVYTVSECIEEPLTDDSVCTEGSLSSIPIEKDVEVIEPKKTAISKEISRTDKQFITQGTRKSYQSHIDSGVIYLDVQVEAKVHKNNKICLTSYAPTGEDYGTICRTGIVTGRIPPKPGSKYLPQGNWKFVVSGDDDYIFKKPRAHND